MTRVPDAQRRLDEEVLKLLRTRGPLTGGQVAETPGLQVFGANQALRAAGAGAARTAARAGGPERGGWGATGWATLWTAAPERAPAPAPEPPGA